MVLTRADERASCSAEKQRPAARRFCPTPSGDFGGREGPGIGRVELGDLDLERIASRAVGPDARHGEAVAVADGMEPAVGQRRSDIGGLDVANEAVHRHGQLKAVFGAALDGGKAGRACDVGVAGTVDELPGPHSFGAGLAANDALGDPSVLARRDVHEAGVQQQFDASAQEQFLKDDGQDGVVEDSHGLLGIRGVVGIQGLEPVEIGDDCIEDLALAPGFAAEVGDAAHRQVAAGDGESFDQQHLCSRSCGGAGGGDASDSAAEDGHVGLVANGHLSAPGDLRTGALLGRVRVGQLRGGQPAGGSRRREREELSAFHG